MEYDVWLKQQQDQGKYKSAPADYEKYRYDPYFKSYLQKKLRSYRFGASNADFKKGAAEADPTTFQKIYNQAVYNFHNDQDIDWGTTDYDPTTHADVDNSAWAGAVKKLGHAPTTDEYKKYYTTDIQYKGQYGNTAEDQTAYNTGQAPMRAQYGDKLIDQYNALAGTYNVGNLSYEKARELAPDLYALAKYAKEQEAARARAAAGGKGQAASYPSQGTKQSVNVDWLDPEVLKLLGYDEKTGFAKLFEGLPQTQVDIMEAQMMYRPYRYIPDYAKASEIAAAKKKAEKKEKFEFLNTFARPDVSTAKKGKGDVSIHGLIFNEALLDDPKKIDAFLQFEAEYALATEPDFQKWLDTTFGGKVGDSALGNLKDIDKKTPEEKRKLAEGMLNYWNSPLRYTQEILSPFNPVGAGIIGAENALTAGLSELATKSETYNPSQYARELRPTAYATGEFVGQIAPISGFEAGTAKLLGEQLMKKAPILTGIIRGSVPMIAYTGIKDVAEGKPAEEVAYDMVVNGGIGAAFGAAGGAMSRQAMADALAADLKIAAKEWGNLKKAEGLWGGIKSETMPTARPIKPVTPVVVPAEASAAQPRLPARINDSRVPIVGRKPTTTVSARTPLIDTPTPAARSTVPDGFSKGLSSGMGEPNGGFTLVRRTPDTAAVLEAAKDVKKPYVAAMENADNALIEARGFDTPEAARAWAEGTDGASVYKVTGRDTGGKVKALEPVQSEAGRFQESKPASAATSAADDAGDFVKGLDEGMGGLPEPKNAGPETIDFTAEGGKTGGGRENIHIADLAGREGAGKTIKLNDLEDFFDNPQMFGDATPNEWYTYFQKNGYNPQPLGSKSSLKGIPFDQGGGFRINWEGDRYLQYHPSASSHHSDAYWKLSSGSTGTLRFDMNGNLIP